jgi:hypothetical protein
MSFYDERECRLFFSSATPCQSVSICSNKSGCCAERTRITRDGFAQVFKIKIRKSHVVPINQRLSRFSDLCLVFLAQWSSSWPATRAALARARVQACAWHPRLSVGQSHDERMSHCDRRSGHGGREAEGAGWQADGRLWRRRFRPKPRRLKPRRPVRPSAHSGRAGTNGCGIQWYSSAYRSEAHHPC